MRIRPYEISLWTLQDSFIAILGSNEISNYRGRVHKGEVVLKTDGTLSFNFSINAKIFDGEKLVDNPLWYDYQKGLLMANLRKVKVIFNKRTSCEKVYEFVITKVNDIHDKDGSLICEVECDGLAFQELGKIGYKISLGLETFEEIYEKWFDSQVGAEPIANLQFWADRLFKNSGWTYKLDMNWDAYDSTLPTNKIYEEDFVSSWGVSNNNVVPLSQERTKEKARIFSCEKENLYNYTQKLAETFGVYCRYEYGYDADYHIISKTCVFYNSFFDENKRINLTYPYDVEVFNRVMESKDLVSKMYVIPIEDSNYEGGMITIGNSDANKSKEDYILNFDYLYEVEAINEQQYAEIPKYLDDMHIYNLNLDRCSKSISERENELVDLTARETILRNSLSLCDEQCNNALEAIQAITGNESGEIKRSVENPEFAYFLQYAGNGYKINITQEGVKQETVRVYKQYTSTVATGEVSLAGAIFNTDNNGNLISITNITSVNAPGVCYLTYTYNPQLHHQNIYNTYANLRTQNSAELNNVENRIKDIKNALEIQRAEYEILLNEKQKRVSEFEVMMGPALKEGYWQPEGYQDYGRKEVLSNVTLFYDSELLDGEQESGYRESINQAYKQYPRFFAPIDKINKDNYDKLVLYSIAANHEEGSFDNIKTYSFGSQLVYGYVSEQLVIYIIDKTVDAWSGTINSLAGQNGDRTVFLGTDLSYFDGNGNRRFAYTNVLSLSEENIIFSTEDKNVNQIPRYIIADPMVRVTADELLVKIGNKLLEKYTDFSLIYKNSYPSINFRPETLIKNNYPTNKIEISYFVSNAATSIYLDALQVSKSNAFPQVSYEVSLTNRDEEEMKIGYSKLGSLALINDYDLKLFAVQGYVSEVTLVLDEPWLDKIVIQNYKTQFEDLFAKIVSSSEAMKMKELVYDRISSAFVGGTNVISENALQSAFDSSNLQLAFEKGTLQIDESEGIWGISDSGVVAFRGGGIFCATEKDQNNNWLWNTGITPEGINASLLTAGQIDTNLIRIFAGNNVRLQLNKDGLIAYKSDEYGAPDPNNYVIHEGEGLFFRSNINDNWVDKVAISWDGLSLRNNNNERVFYADENGNVRIKGHIEATSGNIDTLIVNKLIDVNYPQLTIFAQDGSVFKNNSPSYLQFVITASLFELNDSAIFKFYSGEQEIEYTTSLIEFENENYRIYFDRTSLTFRVKNDIINNGDILKLTLKCIQDENTYEAQVEIYWVNDGAPGKDGVTIVSSTIEYTSGDYDADPKTLKDWKTNLSEVKLEDNQVIWTRMITDYSDDNLDSVVYSRSGKDGTEILRNETQYQILAKGVDPSNVTDGWTDDPPANKPTDEEISWIRNSFVYSNGNIEYFYVKDGTSGEAGRGIKKTSYAYAIGDESANPAEISSWEEKVPGESIPFGKVLWTKITFEYTEGPLEVSYTKGGGRGKDGITVTGSLTEYAASGQDVDPAEITEWKENLKEITLGPNQVLWSRITTTYSDPTLDSVTYTKSGKDGTDGNGIISSVVNYQVLEEGIDPSDVQEGWSSDTPSGSTQKGFILWTRNTFTYDNGDTESFYSKSGASGTDGQAGRGIVSAEYEYTIADEEANPTEINSWDFLIPSEKIESGKVLWTKVTFHYSTDPQTEVFYTKGGTRGTDGVTIMDTSVQYAAASPTINPEEITKWVDNSSSLTIDKDQVLWSKLTIVYSDKSLNTTTYSKSGKDGIDGSGIISTSIDYQYLSKEAIPSDINDGWATSIPENIPSEKPVLWTRNGFKYEDRTEYFYSKSGTSGIDGAPGRGIDHIEYEYAIASEKVDPSEIEDSKWSLKFPTNAISPGNVLWTKTTYVYTDNNYNEVTYIKGGSQGTTITGTSISYVAAPENATTQTLEDKEWKTSLDDVTYESGDVLWIKTVTKYSNSSLNTTSYIKSGKDGVDGAGITSTEIRYQKIPEGDSPSDNKYLNSWSKDPILEAVNGEVIWVRTKFIYNTENKTEVFYTRNGTNGVNGQNGANGVGITKATSSYAIISKEDQFANEPEKITQWETGNPPAVSHENVLWIKMVLTYGNNNSIETTYIRGGSNGEKGDKGDPGEKGEKGDSGEDGISNYVAMISSSNGDSFKSTTDWTVLYCTVSQGGAIVESIGTNLFYLDGADIPTGKKYAGLFYYIVDPSQTDDSLRFKYYQYTSPDGNKPSETSNKPTQNFNYKWTRADQYGNPSLTTISTNNMIYVSRELVDTKATYFCEVSI